jgi:predicted glycoside hydrolase/deacetylase ChbG (UPF0249 family)
MSSRALVLARSAPFHRAEQDRDCLQGPATNGFCMNDPIPRREFLKLPLGAAGAFGAFATLAATRSFAAEPQSKAAKPARLIIRGDDMGCSHSANLALIRAFTEGIQRTIEVIVPGPWFPEAVRLLEQHPGVDVGIHLAITSEWDNVKWRPLSQCPSLVDEDGYFWPMVNRNPNYPGRAIADNPWKLEEVEREFRAQVELGLKRIPRISHVSGHMGCTGLSAETRALTERLTKEYGLSLDLAELGVKGLRYQGPKKTLAEKTASFLKTLDGLVPGETYWFVDHPGLDDPELRAIHHIGYEDVAVDRQGVTDLWTSPLVKAEIERRGIQLISYRDLKV